MSLRREDALIGGDQVRQSVERAGADRVLDLRDEDEPALLIGMHRHQSVRRLVDVGKTAVVRDVLQRAIEAIRPAVVTADERFRAAAAVGEPHAAVAADVAECAHAAVVPAHDDDGYPGGVARDVRAGLGQRGGRAERHGKSLERLELGAESLGAGVVRDRLTPGFGADVGGFVVDVVEHTLNYALVVE